MFLNVSRKVLHESGFDESQKNFGSGKFWVTKSKKSQKLPPTKKFRKNFPVSRFHRFRIDLIGAESGTNFFSLGVKKFERWTPREKMVVLAKICQKMAKNGKLFGAKNIRNHKFLHNIHGKRRIRSYFNVIRRS